MTSLLIGGGIVTIGFLLSELYKKKKTALADIEHLQCDPSADSYGNTNSNAASLNIGNGGILDSTVLPDGVSKDSKDSKDVTEVEIIKKTVGVKKKSTDDPEINAELPSVQAKSVMIESGLTGQKIAKDAFLPSGTEPFYSGSTTQNVDYNKPNMKLAVSTGRDPDKMKQKKAVKTMFNPMNNLSNVRGSAIYNSNIKHRLNTNRYITGERPFEQIQVGPGLNKGFVSEGSGGFQQNNTRDYVMPKTIDQMRTLNNPKLTYKGRTVAPKKGIDKRGKMGVMYKNRVKTVFKKGIKDFFVTTGAIKKDSGRSTIIIKNTNRQISKNIMGNPNNNIGEYNTHSKYKVSSKLTYCNNIARNLDGEKKTNDYGKSSFFLDLNKRNVTELRTHTTNVAKSVKALFVPITDMLRNTTKETTELNTNIGNMTKTTNITNLADKDNVQMNTTIRETLEIRENIGNVDRTEQGIYVHDPNDVPIATNKETSMMINHFNPPSNEQGNGYMTNKHEVRASNRDDMHNEYIGNGNSNHKEAMSYYDMYNAIISGSKEEILEGRDPTTSNVSLTNGSNNVNLQIKKLDEDYINNRGAATTQMNPLGLNIDHYKHSNVIMKNSIIDNKRFNPTILDNMKNNPYVNKSFM